MALSAFVESIQKIADVATNTKGTLISLFKSVALQKVEVTMFTTNMVQYAIVFSFFISNVQRQSCIGR